VVQLPFKTYRTAIVTHTVSLAYTPPSVAAIVSETSLIHRVTDRQTDGHRDRDEATFRQCHNTEYNQHDVAIFPSTKIVILSD